MAKKFFKAAAAITLMMTTVVLTSCTRDNDGSAPGEDPVKAELCAEKAQMIPLFYDYIQQNHASGYQTRWGLWKRQFNDK